MRRGSSLYSLPHSDKLTRVRGEMMRETRLRIAALAVLVALRYLKGKCRRYWFIYRIPEVLIVVIASTGRKHSSTWIL